MSSFHFHCWNQLKLIPLPVQKIISFFILPGFPLNPTEGPPNNPLP